MQLPSSGMRLGVAARTVGPNDLVDGPIAPVVERPRWLAGSLLGALVLVSVAAAFGPANRFVWTVEMLDAAVLVGVVAWADRAVRLTAAALLSCFAFLLLHVVGGHFSYAHVPGPWDLGGRNHYDRVVHFASGLLLTPALREVVVRVLRPPPPWGRLVAASFLITLGALFEVGEMLVGRAGGAALGLEYQAMQGDPFDPVWDIFMAAVGACLAMTLGAAIARRSSRIGSPAAKPAQK